MKAGWGELGEAKMRQTRSRVCKWGPVGRKGKGNPQGSTEVRKAEMVGGSSCVSTLNTRSEAGAQAQVHCSPSPAVFFFNFYFPFLKHGSPLEAALFCTCPAPFSFSLKKRGTSVTLFAIDMASIHFWILFLNLSSSELRTISGTLP